jgi:adenine-specific DNA-methyltransferase
MTELLWDGKYKDGKKQGPVRIALPFQTVETVNESAQDRRRNLELFATGRDTEWRNRLIWGDKKYVLPSLLDLEEVRGKVDLIYIDPPFDTGADFSFSASIPGGPRSDGDEVAAFTKEPSVLEQKAYRDTWGVTAEERERGVTSMDRYLRWISETVVLLREMLAESGTLYLHCNQTMLPYLRCSLDEIFGRENHMNDLIWHFENKPKFGFSKLQPRDWECILVYARKIGTQKFHHQLVPVKEVQQQAIVAWDPIAKKRVAKRDQHGDIVYETRTEKLMGSVWTIPIVHPIAHERTGYDTQKPEPLLERIVKISTDENDLVLDCFVGSGTTAAVSEKLNRRWIACDLGRFSIHTTRKRLLDIDGVKPFSIQNLGKYERQAWQSAEFPANGKDHLEEQHQREAAYRRFILDLYHATPMTGHAWLHGAKSGRMVHVAAVDAPVTQADVKAIARDAWKALGTPKSLTTPTTNNPNERATLKEGVILSEAKDLSSSPAPPEILRAAVDILGWEFALEVNELAKQVAAESRIEVSFKKIPREVLDKKAVEQGDVKFFELGALDVSLKQKGREVTLKLSDFVIPTDDIPEEARKAIKHWSQLVDYWAVDWDFKNDTFHNQWQAYRTRKEPKIDLETTHAYANPGTYAIVVKIIDILGNDTTQTKEVTVK